MVKKLDYITFFNGQKMPIVGLGTMQSPPGEVEKAVDAALQTGYRHIDTAYLYQNEAEIGVALKKWLDSGKLKREDIFIVSKLPMKGNRAESVEKYLKKSLADLQLDYVDLYLIHSPIGILETPNEDYYPTDKDGKIMLDMETDHISLWKALEAQVDAGRARSIGLSNFNARQIKRIWQSARIKPANIQVELHVYFQKKELRAFCEALDVTIVAYGILGSPHIYNTAERERWDVSRIPKLNPLTDPVIAQVAEKHHKSTAQVLLRYIMQLGIAVIPKSTNPERIKQNFDVFDFELSPEDMEALEALDRGSKAQLFSGAFLPGLTEHPEYPWKDRY